MAKKTGVQGMQASMSDDGAIDFAAKGRAPDRGAGRSRGETLDSATPHVFCSLPDPRHCIRHGTQPEDRSRPRKLSSTRAWALADPHPHAQLL